MGDCLQLTECSFFTFILKGVCWGGWGSSKHCSFLSFCSTAVACLAQSTPEHSSTANRYWTWAFPGTSTRSPPQAILAAYVVQPCLPSTNYTSLGSINGTLQREKPRLGNNRLSMPKGETRNPRAVRINESFALLRVSEKPKRYVCHKCLLDLNITQTNHKCMLIGMYSTCTLFQARNSHWKS